MILEKLIQKILILTICSSLIACSAQKSATEKAIYGSKKGLSLKEASRKDPLLVEHLVIWNYTDSIFPNQAILQFPNLTHLEVYAPWENNNADYRRAEISIDSLGLTKLSGLLYLELINFNFKVFPKPLLQLGNLKGLLFALTGLTEIPGEIDKLSQLELLSIRLNNVSSLPISISNIRELKHLDLGNNLFTNIPKVLFDSPSLEVVNLSNPEGYERRKKYYYKIPTNEIDYSIDRNNPISLIDAAQLNSLKIEVLDCPQRTNVRKIVKECDSKNKLSITCRFCGKCSLIGTDKPKPKKNTIR